MAQTDQDPDNMSETETEDCTKTNNTFVDSDDETLKDYKTKKEALKLQESENIEDLLLKDQESKDITQDSAPNNGSAIDEMRDLINESNPIAKGSANVEEFSNLKQDGNLEKSKLKLDSEDVRIASSVDGLDEDKDLNMFASVWVKVEVEEDDQAMQDDLTDVNYVPPSERKSRQRREKGKKQRSRPTKTLNCSLCDYTTVYKTGLVMHMIGHTTEKPHCCTECTYKSKYRNALTRHIKIQHQKEDSPTTETLKVFSCDECDYKTHFKWNLRAHKRKHNADKQFKCMHCDYETAYRHNFMKHSKTHQSKEKSQMFYKCDKCTFVTKFEGHIARHLAKIHNEVTDTAHKCDLCDFSTRVRWRLNIHKARSRQDNILVCAYCDFETYYMCESKKHKTMHYDVMYGHKNIAKDESMEHNSEIEPTTGLHISETERKLHNDYLENHYMDTDQDRSMKNESKYLIDPNCIDWNNIQVLESDDKDRPFQCHMCSYTSRFKASVQRHFQRHHTGSQNRPYKCMNCDFSTKTKDQIALHNKRSKSEMTLYCAICKYTTVYKCQYVMHQKRHYEHKCSQCEYSCKQKYELQKHYMTIHLGNGHKCSYCDYVASRKESLLCHETIHTGIKPFKCDHCEYMSVRRSLLNNHVRKYHSHLLSDVVVVSDSKIASLRQEGSIDLVRDEFA